jgi:cytochrome c-type biogenesis protein
MTAAFVLAFTAGLVATVNPCGIAMLPAYLSYFLGLDDQDENRGSGRTAGRALLIGGVVSLGFLVVFGVVGVLVTLGMRQAIDLIPWAALVVGVGVAGLGVGMLLGFELNVNLPKLGRAGRGRRYGGALTFGISYAVASLSCTLPIFLVVVAGTIPTLSFAGGVATFLVYGLGMSLVLIVLTLAVAFGRRSIVQRIRGSARHVNRVAGGILILAGGYIVYFWTTNLTRDALQPSGLTVLIERVSARVTNLIGNSPGSWGLGLAAVVLTAAAYAWASRRGTRASDQRTARGAVRSAER